MLCSDQPARRARSCPVRTRQAARTALLGSIQVAQMTWESWERLPQFPPTAMAQVASPGELTLTFIPSHLKGPGETRKVAGGTSGIYSTIFLFL